ncbi:MAG: hypothetical protein ACPG19_07350 [Saprospiraceae bacterium]
MKNLVLIITITFLAFTTQAQVLGTFTTSVEGGVKGATNSFSPMIELYALNAPKTNNTLLFDAFTVKGTEEVTFSIANNNDDAEFEAFSNILSTSASHLLKLGHNISGVKSQSASSLTGWFGDDVDFLEKNIERITVTYKNIQFNTENNWTSFSYDLEVKVFGSQSVTVAVGK